MFILSDIIGIQCSLHPKLLEIDFEEERLKMTIHTIYSDQHKVSKRNYYGVSCLNLLVTYSDSLRTANKVLLFCKILLYRLTLLHILFQQLQGVVNEVRVKDTYFSLALYL